MDIDWAALGQVFGVSLAASVALVGVFTLGIVGTSSGGTRTQGNGSVALSRTGAFVCFAVCAAAVAYGIYIIMAAE
jgi:hypothetical protein